MKAIETEWMGYRFRSRTEARWAVFFEHLGLKWQYEVDGYELESGKYLPDFYLPDLRMWAEVKGAEPTNRELALAKELASVSKNRVIILEGAPEDKEQVYYISSNGDLSDLKYMFLEDRRNEGEFWLFADYSGFSIGPVYGPDHDRYPVMSARVKEAYKAAKQARFEHGENPKPKKPMWW